MTNMQKLLKDAQEETRLMLVNCDPQDFWMQVQLRIMMWNLRKFEAIVNRRQRIMSTLRKTRKQRQ